MIKDDLLLRVVTSKYFFLSLGIFFTTMGLIVIFFSLALFYYFFIKKATPENKILRYMIVLSQGFENVSNSFEEIKKWHDVKKIFSAVVHILFGIGFLFVGKLMFFAIK